MPATTLTPPAAAKRLEALDFMRGFIMVLLMLESTELYSRLGEITEGTWARPIVEQFWHHPWHGLHFWDLIQPGFMFIAGSALAYSVYKQRSYGVSWGTSFFKAFKRSWWLFFWGVTDYALGSDGQLYFKLWDVLTQLSFTLLVAFLIYNWSAKWQIAFSIFLLVLTEVLYRYTNIPGFDQPFTDQHNFGNYMDLVLMNKINEGGWVAINCIPTACHTIWGVLAGKLLFSNDASKVKKLLVAGIIALALGFTLDATTTPIIKKIATSSFTLASGGWCLLALAFLYWWIDIKDHKRYLLFFTIVGMNSLFIYLFFEIVVSRWMRDYVNAFAHGIFNPLHIADAVINVIACLAVFAIEWYLCYFLYKKKVFIKL